MEDKSLSDILGLLSNKEIKEDEKAHWFLIGSLKVIESLKDEEMKLSSVSSKLEVVKSNLLFNIPPYASKSADLREAFIIANEEVIELTQNGEKTKIDISFLKRVLKLLEDAHVFSRQKSELHRRYEE
jgi:hypothetical protein